MTNGNNPLWSTRSLEALDKLKTKHHLFETLKYKLEN